MFHKTFSIFYLKKTLIEVSQKTNCLSCHHVRSISVVSNGQSFVGTLCSKFGFLDWFMTGPRGKMRDIASECETEDNVRTNITIKSPYKLHNLSEGPKPVVNVSKSEAKLYYKQLHTIRHIEKASSEIFREKAMSKFCPLTTGQEACAVGMRAAMRSKDKVITTHRCHGWSYLMGVTPFGVLSELIGKQGSCVRGKGGSVHMYAPKYNGGNGILGVQVPIGAGLALGSKLKRDGGACLSVYGSSIANKGHIYESCILAHMWKLPCVFVCENNLSGCPITSYYTRSRDIPGILVDGTDVLAVRQATEYALRFASAVGPVVMELNTSINALTPEMKAVVQQRRDPLILFRRQCIDSGLLNTSEIRTIEKEVCYIVNQATRDALDDGEVLVNELRTDCFEPQIHGTLGNMKLLQSRLKPSRFRGSKSPRRITKSDILKSRVNHPKKQSNDFNDKSIVFSKAGS